MSKGQIDNGANLTLHGNCHEANDMVSGGSGPARKYLPGGDMFMTVQRLCSALFNLARENRRGSTEEDEEAGNLAPTEDGK